MFLRHKDGHPVPVLVRPAALGDAHGSIVAAAQAFDVCAAQSGDDAGQRRPKSPQEATPQKERKGFRMVNVDPTLRIASRTPYTPPALRRKTETPASTGTSEPGTSFGTELKNQSDATSTTATTTATATTTTSSSTDTEPASRMIGTASPWPPATVATTPAATTSPLAPTAQSLFGANPWITDAGGAGPNGSYSYNQYYFATPETAATVAQMLGGKVVTADAITPDGPFTQNEANQMVQMPDGRLINAGLVAGFYDHGYTQQTVDKMIAAEVSGNTMYS
ncbi:MAG: hypothetical protein ABSC05_23310 [Candidatus Solibacter sp.]